MNYVDIPEISGGNSGEIEERVAKTGNPQKAITQPFPHALARRSFRWPAHPSAHCTNRRSKPNVTSGALDGFLYMQLFDRSFDSGRDVDEDAGQRERGLRRQRAIIMIIIIIVMMRRIIIMIMIITLLMMMIMIMILLILLILIII